MTSREALIALNLLPDIGPVRVRNLLERFGNAATVLSAPVGELREVDKVGPKAAAAIVDWRNRVDLAAELKRIESFGAGIITSEDDSYPELLREIYDPPLVLYVRGELQLEDRHAIAMVGTRQSTLYGRQTAERLARQLAGKRLSTKRSWRTGTHPSSRRSIDTACASTKSSFTPPIMSFWRSR